MTSFPWLTISLKLTPQWRQGLSHLHQNPKLLRLLPIPTALGAVIPAVPGADFTLSSQALEVIAIPPAQIWGGGWGAVRFAVSGTVSCIESTS